MDICLDTIDAYWKNITKLKNEHKGKCMLNDVKDKIVRIVNLLGSDC